MVQRKNKTEHNGLDGELHGGHRERMRKRFLIEEKSFSDHELLELLLFYAIPRRNTNEIAHRLLQAFGSLEGVLQAPVSALADQCGLGERSAILLRTCGCLHRRMHRARTRPTKKLDTARKIVTYLQKRMEDAREERMILLLFDAEQTLLAAPWIGTGTAANVELSVSALCREALNHNAACAVLAHNHFEGGNEPSSEDLTATRRVVMAFDAIGIPLLEHLIVTNKECRPILSDPIYAMRIGITRRTWWPEKQKVVDGAKKKSAVGAAETEREKTNERSAYLFG